MKDSKWFRLLVIALASVMVFAACGGDDGGGEEDGGGGLETSSEEVPVEDYVADFCGAMVDWQGSIQELSTDFRDNVFASEIPPEDKKEELGNYLEGLHGITEDFIGEVEAAGTPDVDGGAEVAEQFLSGFRQLTTAIEDVQGQVDELPTDSDETFTTAGQALVGQIQTSFQSIGDGLTNIESAPIDEAFTQEEACSQIQTG